MSTVMDFNPIVISLIEQDLCAFIQGFFLMRDRKTTLNNAQGLLSALTLQNQIVVNLYEMLEERKRKLAYFKQNFSKFLTSLKENMRQTRKKITALTQNITELNILRNQLMMKAFNSMHPDTQGYSLMIKNNNESS